MKLFPIIGAIILFFTFIGADLSWDGSWHYRTELFISNPGTSNITDLQVPINLSYNPTMQSDFSDLMFTWVNSSTELEVPFWIEEKTDSQWAYLWLRVPEIPALGNTSLFVYYHGPALNKSSISDTFIHGDDFTSNTSQNYLYNGTVDWSGDGYLRVSGQSYIHPLGQQQMTNIIVEAKSNYSESDTALAYSGVYALAIRESIYTSSGYVLYNFPDHPYTQKAKYGGNSSFQQLCYDNGFTYCEPSKNLSITSADFHLISLYATSDMNIRAEFDRAINASRGSGTSNWGYFGYITDTDAWLDWLIVRKYVPLQPTYMLGQEGEYSNLTVSIDYPDDGTVNDTNDIFFGYTPIAADYDILNCSLYTTINGVWELTQVNSTPVLNNSLNLFNLTSLLNQTFVWAVGCMDTFHNTHDALYLTANRTLTIAKPSPVQPAASGGGGGMYLAPPAPSIITSRVSYLDFHSSYALNGTRGYFYNATSQTTTITLMITNLLASDRDFVLMDTIPKDMAVDIDNVAISPTPTTVYNLDPEIGWNVTLPAEGTFTAKYIFKKRVSLESFNSMDLPVITEIVKAAPETAAPTPVQTPVSPTPVSPTTTVTTAGGGITGLVVSTFTNPLFAMFLIAIIILVVVFFKMKREKITTFS
jgi:hypothetical protein